MGARSRLSTDRAIMGRPLPVTCRMSMSPELPMRTLLLSNGRLLSYRWRRSLRAKHLGLRLSPQGGLLVTVPRGVTLERVEAVLQAKSGWIDRHLARFAALPPPAPSVAPLPTVIVLPALDECWEVIYTPGAASGVTIRTLANTIALRGAVADAELCRQALRRWLAERAELALLPWLYRLATESGFRYRRAQVRGQRSRWGSCSARGTISLNWQLLFLLPEQVDYVLLHELCHTVELNHSARFWQLLQQHQPDAAALRANMRQAGQALPGWLHAGSVPLRVD